MPAEKSKAIVIRLVEFSESSYIATLFTEDFGKITAMAKGARRRKSSFESALDLLSVSRIVFLRKSRDAMDLLTEAKLEKPFRSSIRSLQRFYAGYYVAELIQSLTDEGDPHRDLFRITQQTLFELDHQGDPATWVARFELRLLRELGHLPSFESCAECGQKVHSSGRVAFGLLMGGVLCSRCKIGKKQVISISQQAIDSLQRLASDSIPENSRPMQGFGEVRAVMNRYVCQLLGRRPRLFDFLGYG